LQTLREARTAFLRETPACAGGQTACYSAGTPRFGWEGKPLLDRIAPGLTGQAEMVVGTNDTAPRVGSGRVAVLATPTMISLIEEAALAAVEHLMPEGKQSLGTHVDVSHVAATPVGMKVRAEAQLISVDGRRLAFAVRARDELDLIGEGRHERVIVTVASFQARINDKAAR
jgi:fluoroacetyl-CoA thioesterase